MFQSLTEKKWWNLLIWNEYCTWALLCHARFFSHRLTFRVVTVVTVVSQSFNYKPQGQAHYWHEFQFWSVKAMWNPLLCSFNLFDSCCNCHWPMLVYNYGNEDGEGAWLPVWVGLGGEAATITLTNMKLTCEILKCMCSHVSFCHVMCSTCLCWNSHYWAWKCLLHLKVEMQLWASSDSVMTTSRFGSGQVILGLRPANSTSSCGNHGGNEVDSWRSWWSSCG